MNESGTIRNVEPATDVREEANPVQPRLWLWVAGSVMWVAVGVAAVYLYANRPDAPVTVLKSNGGASGESAAPAAQPPEMVWDPNGVEDFEFAECRGGTVSKQDLLGKPWLATFVFTRCQGTCPRIMRSTHELERALKDVDLRFVSFTVDPEFDTVEVLRKEAENYEAPEGRWLLLTGDRAKIYHLIAKSFQMPVKEITGPERQPGFEVLHSNNIMLVDAGGVVVGKYDGTNGEDMAKLRRRVREMVPAETKASR
ncbi:MAG: SCO family protein [Planctomycetaceae bacterium]